MLTLPKHNRYDYSVIGERKDYSWPGGKRLAFCTTTNIEVYAYRKGTGWDPGQEGRAAAAAQLLLARLRQPRRHLAAVRSVRAAQAAGRAQHQLAALRISSADHRQDQRARRRGGRSRPHQRRAAGRPLGARREAADRRRDGRDHQARGQAAEGLDGSGRRREPGHDRSAQGGRLQIRDGLAGGRPAVLAEDALGADPVGALSGGAERFRLDHPPREHRRSNSPT